MAAIPWMPLYIADYLADTGHLGTIDHGAYFLMMMHYWTKGPLPTDDGQLRKIARMTPREWADARGVLLDFFHNEGGVYRHKRIDAELATATALIETKSKAGSAGAAKRWQNHKHNDGTANASAITEPLPEQCARTAHLPSPSPSIGEISSLHREPRAEKARSPRKVKTSLPDNFPDEPARRRAQEAWSKKGRPDLAASVLDEIEKFRDHHIANNKGSADWPASWRTWISKAPQFTPQQRMNGNGRRESPLEQSERIARELNAEDAGYTPADQGPSGRPRIALRPAGDE